MDRVKIKVFASHKPIGWLRELAGETVLSANMAKATTYETVGGCIGEAQASFQGPESATSKGTAPVVTFQLCRV